MKRAYFYAPNVNPILLRVLENFTVPVCTEDPMNITSQKRFTAGWTSSGVFTTFDPMTVNFMQLQLPFAVMRFCYTTMKKHIQGRSQDFHKGGAQLESEVTVVCGKAAHGQLCWP